MEIVLRVLFSFRIFKLLLFDFCIEDGMDLAILSKFDSAWLNISMDIFFD